ncbi:MAG: peptide-methionine (S)-S-oxide reductase MsrA [Bacilli bacterium]|nr:peptide-methionine (S)-S-oxide reductase MsrA [Bacilli bacterium]
MKTIYLAGGCFWGVEAYYSRLKGVINTEVGYANGNKANPTYQEVKSHIANHAETLKLDYDESVISLKKILEHFLRFVDPYSIDKQGEDSGHQYRSGVYYINKEDEKVIRDYFDSNLESDYQIEILPLENFYSAEEYHQDYLEKNPSGYCHVNLNLIRKDEKK